MGLGIIPGLRQGRQRNAHHEATRSRKNFSALHFSVIALLS